MTASPSFQVVHFKWVNVLWSLKIPCSNKYNRCPPRPIVKHVHFINAYIMIYSAIQNAVLPDGRSASQSGEFQRKDTEVTMTKSMSFETYFLTLKLH